MENQKQPKASGSNGSPASSVNPPTVAPSAPTADSNTTSKSSLSVQNPSNPFKGSECIILVLAPNKTVHPVINKPGSGNAGIRIFDTPELAALELMNNKVLMSHPSAIIPLKEFFS